MSPNADQAYTLPWPQLTDAQFMAGALPVAESLLDAAHVETKLVATLDDELTRRITLQRARARREPGQDTATRTDLRPLCHLLLMVMDRACKSEAGPLVARALRLAGHSALLSLLAREAIAASTWQLAHSLYRLAETAGGDGLADDMDRSFHDLYLQMLLLSTLSGNGLSPRQTDKCFDWFEAWTAELRLASEREAARHYLAVDLSSGTGLVAPDAGKVLGEPRYLDHARLVEYVAAARSDYFRQISVATLGEYSSNPLFEYHDALHQLGRYWEYVGIRHAGHDSGRQRIEAVEVAATAGFEQCLNAIERGTTTSHWLMVDLSPTGAGFRVTGFAGQVEKGSLSLFADPEKRCWVLGAVVRVAVSGLEATVGVRRLADNWRHVHLQEDAAGGDPVAAAGEGVSAFFVFGDEARGLADSVILRSGTFDPGRTYSLRPGRDQFKIRMSRVIQSAGDWERVGFDVVKRLKAGD